MRDRLSQLIFNKLSETCGECSSLECTEKLTDYLLANGVIVPPCKVGDTVYFVARNSGRPIGTIYEIEIVQIARRKEGFHAKGRFKGNLNEFEIRYFKIDNYSFFLIREEAEAALVNYESSTIEKGGAE